jgi:hypothetical protein
MERRFSYRQGREKKGLIVKFEEKRSGFGTMYVSLA